MKKMTLLEMVQNIASALETDEINSITDTTESLQIAEVIKETYYEQFNDIGIPEHTTVFQLESLSDVTRPNYLRIPDNISNVEWIRYYDYGMFAQSAQLDYVTPEDFFEVLLRYWIASDPMLTSILDSTGVTYYVPNNSRPTEFTILADNLVVFNAYDSVNEATMQGSKSFCFGTKVPEFLLSDNFVPLLDGNLFPLLLAEAKSVCFINLKQISSSKEEQRARRQRIRMQNDQYRSKQAQSEHFNRRGNYARHR